MKQKNKIFTKIIYILLIIILLSFSFPKHSNAASFNGILTKPVCYLIISAVDEINVLLSLTTIPVTENIKNSSEAWEGLRTALSENDGEILNGNTVAGAANGFVGGYYNLLMSPDKIFKGEVTLLDANIFDAPTDNGGNFGSEFGNFLKKGDTSLASALKRTVSNIYILLRNICAVVLLCLLIYTGIRILLMSASPYDQAKWRKALIEWVKALCLLMFMHFIMVGIFYLSDLIVDALGSAFGDLSIVASIRWGFTNQSIWDSTGHIITTILYLYVTYLTIVFFVAYFKRFVWIVILTVISPVVATTYALGNNQTKIFNTWVKEYIFAVLLQPFHMLIFYVLVAVPLNLISDGKSGWDIMQIFDPTQSSSVLTQLYVLLSISMIRPAEKFLMKLFGFDTSVAKQGSSESGVKTIKAGVELGKEVVNFVVKAGAAVASGGATLGMTGGGGGIPPRGPGGPGGPRNSGGFGLDNGSGGGPGGPNLPNEYGPDGGPDGPSLPSASTGLEIDGQTGLPIEPSNPSPNGPNSDGGLVAANASANASIGPELRADNVMANMALVASGGAVNVDNAQFNGDINSKEKNDKNIIDENKPGNRLRDRLKDYARTPEFQNNLSNLHNAGRDLRDTMYLDGDAPGEWRDGSHGYNNYRGNKGDVNAFVNNKNNVNYMMREHGLTENEAKERLQEAAPYVNRGITDVAEIDRLISGNKGSGNSTVTSNARFENVINDKSKVEAMSQIIASRTGESASSPRVEKEAKATIQQAKPYIEAGEKDPAVLDRLVRLEDKLKRRNAQTTPKQVMELNKSVEKAVKEGTKRIKLPDLPDNSKGTTSTDAGVKEMEKEIKKALSDNNSKNAG